MAGRLNTKIDKETEIYCPFQVCLAENWNLNGNDSKYQFKLGQSGKRISEGYAYIFD